MLALVAFWTSGFMALPVTQLRSGQIWSKFQVRRSHDFRSSHKCLFLLWTDCLVSVYFFYFFQVSKLKVRKVTVASLSCNCKDDIHDFFVLFLSGLTYLGGKIARLWGCRIENNVAADWLFSVKLGLCFCSREAVSICRDLSLSCFVSWDIR